MNKIIILGLSVGNEDMFGPIAINNKYNINWGFFNDLSKMFSQPMRQVLNFIRFFNF